MTKTHHEIIIHFYLNDEKQDFFHYYKLIFKFYVVQIGFK
jgi:hypothetical protein